MPGRDEHEVARRGRVDGGLDRRVVLGDAEGLADWVVTRDRGPGTVGEGGLVVAAGTGYEGQGRERGDEETGGSMHGPSVCGGHPATTMVPPIPLVAVPWSEQ